MDPKGSEALTRYRRLERLEDADLLDVEPLTGRRHQIRVHCYAIGHPVLGDTRYGAEPARGRSAAADAARRRAAAAGGSDGEPLVDPRRLSPPEFEAVLDGLR